MPTQSTRYLFDEDLIGVGLLIQQARGHADDVWVIGHGSCPIRRTTPDEKWLPLAGQERLIVFRIDNDLLKPGTGPYEKWRTSGCRGFVLALHQSKSSLWRQLKTIIRYWDRIEEHADARATDPWWIAKLNTSGVKPA